MNSYELNRNFFDWCFENPEKVTPNHVAIYMFSIEHCNRLGWKSKFGFPTQMAMDAVGIKNWRTYSKALNELVEWGFIDMLEKSKNQYSSCIIAIVKNTKANTKALTKATQSHVQKQVNSIAVINKPNNQITSKQESVNIEGFILWFNKMILKHNGKEGKFKKLSQTDINNLTKLKELEFDSDDWEKAFISMNKSKWVIENKMCNPSHYLRNENFQKYLNQYEPNSEEEFTFAWNR